MDCLFQLFEENAQNFLEANLGRELTPMEMNRMKLALIENEDAQLGLMDMMYFAGKEAMDNTNGQWDDIDKDFSAGIYVLTY